MTDLPVRSEDILVRTLCSATPNPHPPVEVGHGGGGDEMRCLFSNVLPWPATAPERHRWWCRGQPRPHFHAPTLPTETLPLVGTERRLFVARVRRIRLATAQSEAVAALFSSFFLVAVCLWLHLWPQPRADVPPLSAPE